MRKYYFYSLLLFLLMNVTSLAQDIHFSQFYNSPLTLNPALTGQFNGDYRFVGNHRRQWASIDHPFTTFGVSADARNFLKVKHVGAGISIYNDKAGTGELGTLQLQAAFSYSLQINSDSTAHIVFGVQSGWNRRQIDYNNFTFDNQFVNNQYSSTASTGETFDQSSTNYVDVQAGVAYIQQFAERTYLTAGFAAHNLLTPDVSLSDQEDQLDRRYTLHGAFEFPVSSNLDLIPRVITMFQGPHNEIVAGGDAKYILDDRWFHYRAIYLGAYSRIVDAAILRVGMDYDSWHVGLSYDINYSTLDRASNAKGGFELSVIYILRNVLPKRTKFKSCPDFI
tara:strand:+ start:6069 stop:7079 length:1011 start_codon:yes stop_codon:yes gene_type:complete